MARWTDITTRQEYTVNQGGVMSDHRGAVVHIAQGSYEGTIAWQRNPDAETSSHFIVSKTGQITQMVDTDVMAWCQADGNGSWISIENEGWSGTPLTGPQLDANARIFAKVCSVYGCPPVVTSSPTGRGLGHHSMGGVAWGNHPDCPGNEIIRQKQAIVDLAKGGPDVALTDQEHWRLMNTAAIAADLGRGKDSTTVYSDAGVPSTLDLTPYWTRVGADLNVQLDALAAKVADRLKALTFVAGA